MVMAGIDLNAALSFWILTRLVIPACGLLFVLIVISAVREWWRGRNDE